MRPLWRYATLLGLSLGGVIGLGGPAGAESALPLTNALPLMDRAPTTFDRSNTQPESAVSLELFQQMFEAGEHDRALAMLERLLTDDPGNVGVLYLRSLWLVELRRHEEAVADLRRVTELSPYFAEGWGNLSWELIMLGDFAEARHAVEKAQSLDPDQFAWTINFGHTFLLQGDRKTAHEWYEKAIPLIPDEESLQQGPLADFDLFIERGWQKEAAREERAWVESVTLTSIPKNRRVFDQYRLADEILTEAWQLASAKDYKAAAKSFERAVATERESGRPRQGVAWALNWAGSMYSNAGQYPRAEALYREALEIDKAALPKGHPGIALSLNNLAGLLQTIGRYAEAEPLFREALEISQAALPKGHPDIASCLNKLGGLLQTTGRYAEAEPLLREALEIRKTALPKGHPDIGASLNDLAELLRTTGHYAEAEPLYREALIVDKAVLPENDLRISRDLNNLGLLLVDTGRYGEAEPLYRDALAIIRTSGSENDHFLATCLNNLGLLLRTTGRYAEAEPLFRAALIVDKAALPGYPLSVSRTLNNLALLLVDIGRYGDAEPLYREALEIVRAALPGNHIELARVLNNLAQLLEISSRYADAEPFLREALAIQKAALPEGHPDIGTSIHNLAHLLQITGRHADAESLYRDALRIAEGGGNPESLWTVNGNLSSLYNTQNQRPLAIFFGKQAVNTLQSIRQNLARADQSTQQSFLKTKEVYYKHLADLLIAEGPSARGPASARDVEGAGVLRLHPSRCRRRPAPDPGELQPARGRATRRLCRREPYPDGPRRRARAAR
jgi:tetratricopeptide (TPR) repeat protein